jgi:hypothetical protein
MSEDEQSRTFADLTKGIPTAPGLGPIADRIAAQGLPTLDAEHARWLVFFAGERGLRRALVSGRSADHAAACLAHRAPMAQIVIAVDARQSLDQGEAFDLVHLDGEVSGYRRLLDLVITRIAVQGTLLFHGLPVVGPEADAARAFCGYLLMHPQLQATVLDVGSGLAVARKIQPLVTDLGGPY